MALVIEWDDIADVDDRDDRSFSFEERVTMVHQAVRPPAPSLAIATAVGALGILALAAWGIHRLVTA